MRSKLQRKKLEMIIADKMKVFENSAVLEKSRTYGERLLLKFFDLMVVGRTSETEEDEMELLRAEEPGDKERRWLVSATLHLKCWWKVVLMIPITVLDGTHHLVNAQWGFYLAQIDLCTWGHLNCKIFIFWNVTILFCTVILFKFDADKHMTSDRT